MFVVHALVLTFMTTPLVLLFYPERVRVHEHAIAKSGHTHQHDDEHQGKMVAKAYAFLHDHLPEGLTGQWDHIHGDELMEILMCHQKEFSVTRHRATLNAMVVIPAPLMPIRQNGC